LLSSVTILATACTNRPPDDTSTTASSAASAAPSPMSVAATPTREPAAVVRVAATVAPHSASIAVAKATVAPATPTARPGAQVASIERPTLERDTVIAGPHDPPRIVGLATSETAVHSGDFITGHVRTTSNVVSVEARVPGFSMRLAKKAIGRFELAYHVPDIPFFLKREYEVEIIARNIDGKTDRRVLSVTLE
jgi:hypothetical protein